MLLCRPVDFRIKSGNDALTPSSDVVQREYRHPEVRAQRASKGDGPGASAASFEGRFAPSTSGGRNKSAALRPESCILLSSDIEILVTIPLTFVTDIVTCHPLAQEGASTGDSRLMGRVRFLRAGLVTPLPGGPAIVPAGSTTGARGASLKRDW
jgi:hypothetical protein